MKTLILSFVIFSGMASSSLAQFAETGAVRHQIPASLEPITVASMSQGAAYSRFERQLLANINNTKRLFSLLYEFDSAVTDEVSDQVEAKVYSLVFPPDRQNQSVRASLPEWSLPIYDYTEGIPEGRVLGNLGEVIQPYVRINSDLRNPAPDSPATIHDVARIRRALSYLPRYEGISFRGARLSPAQAASYYQVGKLAQDKAFISTSMWASVAKRFSFPLWNLAGSEYQKINIMFVIKGYSGRPVSPIADDHNDEKEILFANGTNFKVVAKSPIVRLREYGGDEIAGPDPEHLIGGLSQIIYLQEAKKSDH